MKKIVLAKLNHEETDKLITVEANAHTFQTLLDNCYISEKDKGRILKQLNEIALKKNELYMNIISKYNIPFSSDAYKISPETNELYIEVQIPI